MSLIRWIAGGAIALAVCSVVALNGHESPARLVSHAVEPATFQDPAVPLIALPTTFASRREKKRSGSTSPDLLNSRISTVLGASATPGF